MKQNFTVRKGALDGVEAFLSVAQNRNFRQAAAELGVTPSAISQAVRALEARLGATLFMRTTRSVGLTEAGERFLARAKPAFEELVSASAVARELGQRPTGLLRLSVPPSVVPILLEPLIASFHQAYPEIEVEIAASAELVDLAAEGLRCRHPDGPVHRRGHGRGAAEPAIPFHRRRQPGLLRAPGSAHQAEDLRQHACVRIRRCNGALATWSFAGATSIEIAVVRTADRQRLSDPAGRGGRRRGACPGARADRGRAGADGKLVQVLEPFAPIAPGVFLYYPSRRQIMPKLRAFIDHVRSRAPG